jgi:hypothetical protein
MDSTKYEYFEPFYNDLGRQICVSEACELSADLRKKKWVSRPTRPKYEIWISYVAITHRWV